MMRVWTKEVLNQASFCSEVFDLGDMPEVFALLTGNKSPLCGCIHSDQVL